MTRAGRASLVRVCASACVVGTMLLASARAASLRRAPTRSAPRRTQASSDCGSLPGVWTGFEGSTPLYDSYQLSWRPGGAYPVGAFSAVYIQGSAPGWTLGEGQLGAGNGTATIAFDSGVTLSGTVSDACSTIVWDNGSSWRKTTALPKKVHMVFMNHLDIGYNGIPATGFVNNILNLYFSEYFPRAIAIAEALRARNGSERFIYTTHPFLVDLYLNCPANFSLSGITLQCPSPADQAALRSSILAGDINFHAATANMEYGGALNGAALDASFDVAKRIADQIGVPRPIVASLRDVPGAPRSLIPALVRNQIPVLSIGVNDYAPRPQIPTPCVWQDPDSNTSVLLLMTEQGQGYPDNVGPSPELPGGLGADYCVSHPASAAVLCWAFRTDNSGPPTSVAEVLNNFDIARWQWPGAEVVASTFDAWWAEFQSVVPQLPVVTQEAGETWILGFAADPFKDAFYRTAAREYAACVAAGACDRTDPRVWGFSRMLTKLFEHTWGLPTISDAANFTNVEFHAALAAQVPTYQNSIASWKEQREFGTVYALQALEDHPLRAQIEAAATLLTPAWPSTAGLVPLVNRSMPLTVALPGGGSVVLAVDAATGALASLAVNGTVLADAAHPLALLQYSTYNDTTFNAQHIITPDLHTCCCCYGWTNMQKMANPQEYDAFPTATAVWVSGQPGSATLKAPATVLVSLSFPSLLNAEYGAPAASWLNYTVNADGSVAVELQLFNKTATRLGEALFLRFATPPVAGSAWLADVLGFYVDPLDVVVRGSQHQHGVGESVVYLNAATGAGLAVETLDAPIMSPWTAADARGPIPYIVPYEPLVGPVEGFASLLFQNVYNTNFPLFSMDANFKYRFNLRLLAPSADRADRARRVMVSERTQIAQD